MGKKYLWNSSIFRNFTRCNNFSKGSLRFKKMANSLRKVLQSYSEIYIYCVIQYIDLQEQSIEGTLGKYLKTVLDEVYFIVHLYSSLLPLFLQVKPSFPKLVICLPPRQTNSQNSASSSHINNILSVHPFLDSKP